MLVYTYGPLMVLLPQEISNYHQVNVRIILPAINLPKHMLRLFISSPLSVYNISGSNIHTTGLSECLIPNVLYSSAKAVYKQLTHTIDTINTIDTIVTIGTFIHFFYR